MVLTHISNNTGMQPAALLPKPAAFRIFVGIRGCPDRIKKPLCLITHSFLFWMQKKK